MNTTLIEYSREILPKLRELDVKKTILKDWKSTDKECLAFAEEIKEVQERLKKHIEDSEAELLREIKDIEMDVKLAVKAASKAVVTYSAAELKKYFVDRSKDKVEDVVQKGVMYGELDSMLQ